jgi:exosortase N
MGLSMMEASLLLGVLLVVFFERRWGKRMNGLWVLVYFGSIVLLNIIANLFRIIILVRFTVLPDTVSHEIAGLACLLLYVFIPAVFLARFFVKRSRPQPAAGPSMNQASRSRVGVHVFVLACMVMLAVYVMRADTYRRFDLSQTGPVKEFAVSVYEPGILKLQGKQSLIYIKYIRGFYDTDHNPMLCWTGSGYTVEQVQKVQVGHSGFYTGVLVNGNDRLYSAWWYSNGATATVNQLAWRWDMLKNRENYAVINVTCASAEELNKEVKNITGNNILSSFFHNPIVH